MQVRQLILPVETRDNPPVVLTHGNRRLLRVARTGRPDTAQAPTAA